MNKCLLVCTLFIAILSGCDNKPAMELTQEQAVYEALFLEIIENAHTEYYLVGVTESHWFENNPFDESEWVDWLDAIEGIDIETIERLYQNNKSSEPIEWVPFITNAQILPAEYNVESHLERDKCFVPEGEGDLGANQNYRSYRHYYTISNVAFSTDGKNAVLKFSRHCAPLSGGGEFFVSFMFEDNQWKVTSSRTLWIS